jgi:site-specific DNA-methyltransferase (adenine-specific)
MATPREGFPTGPLATLHCGDCIDVVPAQGVRNVDLVYVDPPFNTGRTLTGRGGLRFDDRFAGTEGFLAFLRPRLEACIGALAPDGAILVHVDWRTSHRVRVLLDELLGEDAFVNHIVWHYGLGGSGPRSFARKHDDILFYAKGRDYHFTPPMVPARSARLAGRMKKATDVLDIPAINNMALERTGWPTQKPLALLSTLVEACCPPGGMVLDPMCGSGTTLVAAVRSGRSARGIDVDAKALRIASWRLSREGVSASAGAGAAVRTRAARVARAGRTQTAQVQSGSRRASAASRVA